MQWVPYSLHLSRNHPLFLSQASSKSIYSYFSPCAKVTAFTSQECNTSAEHVEVARGKRETSKMRVLGGQELYWLLPKEGIIHKSENGLSHLGTSFIHELWLIRPAETYQIINGDQGRG